MSLPECLFVLIGALCCYAAPASDPAIPENHCGQPPRLDLKELSGTWNKQSYPGGTQASYTCSPGYVRQGPTQFVCTQGKWVALKNNPCKKRSCGHPGDIEFGSFELTKEEQFVFGAVVQYKCDDGYRMITRYNTRLCSASGWTNHPPICEVKKCGPVVVNNNVNILYTSDDDEHTVGQVVRFECKNADDTLKGPSEIFCTSEGEWNEKPPSCIETVCNPPKITHGKSKADSAQIFKNKQKLNYECDEGYKSRITPQITCTPEGWSPAPMCEEVFCNLENVKKGFVRDRKPEYRNGDTVILECDQGYKPKGNPDEPRKCTSNGWSPPLECISKQCSEPEIENGHVLYGWSYGYPSFPMYERRSFYYSCSKGFSPPNKGSYDRSYCTREGWSPQPTCSKQCTFPSSEEMNAVIQPTYSVYFEGEKMHFYCKSGYKTQDGRTSGEIECLFDGTFTKEKCLNFCSRPQLDNGLLETNKMQFEEGSVIMYTCKEGYYSNNKIFKDTSYCHDSEWAPSPKCQAITCNLDNNFERKVFQAGDIVHFKCQDGQQLQGNTFSQCYYYGWYPKVPVCKVPGYSKTQAPFINYDNTTDLKCPPASAPPNAELKYLNDDEVKIVCSHSYVLDGPEKISCTNGKWQSPPMCIKAQKCAQPPLIDNGELIKTTSNYITGSTVKYVCKEGYRMNSSDENLCMNRQWVRTPTCQEIPCGEPAKIENGRITNIKPEYQPGDRVTYECNTGYMPRLSRNTATCSKGRWVGNPECIDSTCKNPPAVANGNVKGTILEKYYADQRVEYECKSGYSMKDNINYITCKNSEWTKEPECRRTGESCGLPPVVNYGDIEGKRQQSYKSGSSIKYICMQLHTLEGDETIYCKNGEWGKPPSCREPCTVRVSEMQRNNIVFKYIETQKLYSTHADFMSFICKAGYDIPDTKALRIQCMDGKLNFPKCYKSGFCKLEQLKINVNNIYYNESNIVENGNTITFECAEGMISEDSLEAKCTDGSLNYPKCITSRPCSAPDIQNVILSPKKEKYSSGSSANIDCQDPYVINGPKIITCNNGQWRELPVCRSACTLTTNSLNEKNLEVVSNEDISKTHKDNAEVNVACKERFRSLEKLTAVCDNGKMKYPKCFPLNLGICKITQEGLDENMLVLDENHNDSGFYGENETVYFKCKQGSSGPSPLTGKCAKTKTSVELQYPKCSTTAVAAESL